jgi:hypothetical protein
MSTDTKPGSIILEQKAGDRTYTLIGRKSKIYSKAKSCKYLLLELQYFSVTLAGFFFFSVILKIIMPLLSP